MSEQWDIEAAVLKGLILRRGAAGGDRVNEAMSQYEKLASNLRTPVGMLALLDLEADVAEILAQEVEEHVAMLRGTSDWLDHTPPAERLLARTMLGDGRLSVPQVADALRKRQDLLKAGQRHGLFQLLISARAIRPDDLVTRLGGLTVLECEECKGIALQLPQVAGEAEEIETCGKCMIEMAPLKSKLDPLTLSWADFEDVGKGAKQAAEDLLADKEKLETEGKKKHATGKFGGKTTRRRSRRIARASGANQPAPPNQSASQTTWIVAGVMAFLAVIALLAALIN